MNFHKYDSVIKFVKLDGVKEFKETNPSLFSEDGISTSTLHIENGKTVNVTLFDAKNACDKFLNGEISSFQLQQWGEWIHMMDFFTLTPDGEEPENDETLIDVLTEIDNLDLINEKDVEFVVKNILNTIDNWINSHH